MANSNGGGFGGVSVGRPGSPEPKPQQPKPPNTNLTSALQGSLELMKGINDEIPSPLTEATPDSIDILLDRINSHMIEGKILSDDDLRLGINMYRALALRNAQEQQTKKPRTPRGSKSSLKAVLDLDFGEDLLDGGGSEQ